MKYPLVSLGLAFLFCFIVAVSMSFSKKSTVIPATVEIDAVMIEEVFGKKSVEKIQEKNLRKLPEKADLPTISKEKQQAQNQSKENLVEQKKLQNSQANKSQETPQEKSQSDSKNKVLILYGPLPKIPEHLKEEAFNSYAMARFYISEDGSSRVELIKPCSNPELNYLLMKSLGKWKFASSDKKSIQDIRVNFKVE